MLKSNLGLFLSLTHSLLVDLIGVTLMPTDQVSKGRHLRFPPVPFWRLTYKLLVTCEDANSKLTEVSLLLMLMMRIVLATVCGRFGN